MADNTEKLVMLIEAQNKDVLRKLNQIEKITKKTFTNSSKSLKKFNGDLGKAAISAKNLVAAFFGVKAINKISELPALVRSVVSEASQIGKVADKIGLTTDELQRLRFGFELTGVAANQTDTAMQRFSRRVAQAANGSGELYEILKQNGVALREQDGSMRSQSAILRDYANLIKNAGSEQERLLLAFKAFDTEGAALVNGLKAGAGGLDDLMRKADAAGGVLEEELIRKAEEIDDQFTVLWRNFSMNAKSAILESVSALSQLGSAINTLGMSLRDAMPAWMQENNARRMLREGLSGELTGQRNVNSGMFYRDDIGAPTSQPLELTVNKQTIIPNQQRDKAAGAAKKQADAVLKVIEALQAEQAQIGMNTTQQRVMNEIRAAGTSATEEQKQKITELVTEIERQKSAQEAIANIGEMAGQALTDQFSVITSAINTGNEALDKFLQNLAQAAFQAAFLGSGPLAGLFGGGGGGGFLGGLFGGFRAAGGPVSAGKAYMVGERGPEMIVPRGPGQVIPNGALGAGGGAVVNIAIDATGADASGLARVQGELRELKRTLPKQIISVQTQRQVRGTA